MIVRLSIEKPCLKLYLHGAFLEEFSVQSSIDSDIIIFQLMNTNKFVLAMDRPAVIIEKDLQTSPQR